MHYDNMMVMERANKFPIPAANLSPCVNYPPAIKGWRTLPLVKINLPAN